MAPRFIGRAQGERKKPQIFMSDLTHKRLGLLSGGRGPGDLQMGDVLHVLVQLLHLRVQCAKASAEIPPMVAGGDPIEQFTLLILRDCGLIAVDEFSQGLILTNRLGSKDVADRIEILADVANERIAELEPMWAKLREQAAQQYEAWDAAKAAEQAATKTPAPAAAKGKNRAHTGGLPGAERFL